MVFHHLLLVVAGDFLYFCFAEVQVSELNSRPAACLPGNSCKNPGDQGLSALQRGSLKKKIKGVEESDGHLDEFLDAQDPVMNIAYSWEPDGSEDYPWLLTRRKKIFKFSETELTKETINEEIGNFQEISTSDKVNRATSVAQHLAISGSYLAFSAAADMSLKRSEDTKHKTFRFDRYTMAKKVEVIENPRWQDLLPEVQNDLLELEAADIVKEYGQFYAEKIILGAMFMETIKTDMVNEDTDAERKAAIKAEYGVTGFSAGIDADHEKKVKASIDFRESEISIQTYGGDSTTFMNMKKDEDNTDLLLSNWVATIKPDKYMPVDKHLKNLWEIYRPEDKTKADKLKNYLEKKWKDDAAQIQDRSQIKVDPLFYPGVSIDLMIEKSGKKSWCWVGSNSCIYCNENWDWNSEARFLVEEAGYKKIYIKGGPMHEKKYCQVRSDNIVRCTGSVHGDKSAIFIVESKTGGWFNLKNERSGKYCSWRSRELKCEDDEPSEPVHGSFFHHVQEYPKPAKCWVKLCRDEGQTNCNGFAFGPGRYDIKRLEDRLEKAWRIKSLEIQGDCSAAVYRSRWFEGRAYTYTANVDQLDSGIYNYVGSLKVCSKYHDDRWEKCGN